MEEEDLDTSWIDEAEFKDNYQRELMKDIRTYFIYIDGDGSIEKITKDSEFLDNGIISKQHLLHLIQNRRYCPDKGIHKKYKLIDLLFFHVPLESDQLRDFVSEKSSSTPQRDDNGVEQLLSTSSNEVGMRKDSIDNWLLRSIPIFDSVVVDPSIFIFHDLNSLFFLFKEVEPTVIKSILKNGSLSGSLDTRVTKKVRLPVEEYIDKKRKSMKRMLRRHSKQTRKNL